MIKSSPEALAAILKKGMHAVYFVFGDEDLLVMESVSLIRSNAKALSYLDRQVIQMDASGFDIAELIEASQSVSLFSDKKLLEIRLSSGKMAESLAILQQLVTQPPEDTIVILQMGKVDSRQKKSKWFEALSSNSLTVECKLVGRNDLPRWMTNRLQLQGQKIDADALAFLCEQVEGNLLAAHQEVVKLGLLYAEEKISLSQIESAVANVARFEISSLSQAWMSRDIIRVNKILSGLEAEGEAMVLVLWNLTEDLRNMLKIQAGLNTGKPISALLNEHRMWGEKQRWVEPALQRLGAKGLLNALVACAKIDRQFKGAEAGDPWFSLHVLMKSLAS